MKKILFSVLVIMTVVPTMANNVRISNVGVVNNGSGDVRIKFDVAWDNSWRVNTGQNNHDGAWVFFKYRKKGTANWLPISFNGLHNSSAPDYAIYQAKISGRTDYAGAIIYRGANGTGNVNFTNIQLSTAFLPYDVDISAFAIEMVYIPRQNGIYLGDGNGTNQSTFAFCSPFTTNRYANTGAYISSSTNIVYAALKSEPNALDDDNLNWENGKELYMVDSGFAYSNSQGAIVWGFPAATACWAMKYEISQGAYRDFLNSLTLQQQTTRTAAAPTSAQGTLAMVPSGTAIKNFIKIQTSSTGGASAVYGCDADNDGTYNGVNDGEWTACGYLSYPDVAAYLYWSGLAPITEVLYERMCTGFNDGETIVPTYGNYAWGTNQITATRLSLNNRNAASETAGNMTASETIGYGNYQVSSPMNVHPEGEPLRNGMFAAFSGTTRVTSGSSYFGVMELSGNLQEVCVTIANATGRLFAGGLNGPGMVSTNGNADGRAFWPGGSQNPNETTASFCRGCDIIYGTGTIMRGGSFGSGSAQLRTADRSQGEGSFVRLAYRGGRGALYCN